MPDCAVWNDKSDTLCTVFHALTGQVRTRHNASRGVS